MIRLTVLGSGTLLPDAQRGSPAHYVEAGDARLLLDCGAGTLHSLARWNVDWRRLSHVALTHFHADHIGELAALLFAFKYGLGDGRGEPLTLIGPRGTLGLLQRLRDAHGDFVLEPGVELVIRELDEGAGVEVGDQVWLRSHPTVHASPSVAYRCERGTRAVGYTGDAGWSDGLAAFMAGVDVLVCECSVPDSSALETHLSPSTVARLASVSRPGLVVITHVYSLLDPVEVPRLVYDAGYHGPVISAVDGLTFSV
ncbi:MAG: ribonuclease Z [Gemmatimonadetes bacterium]|nr:ribonuclease Z [Gemmatimonadota bacterium]